MSRDRVEGRHRGTGRGSVERWVRLVSAEAILVAVCCALAIAPARAAGDEPPKSIFDLKMFRLEFDNDNLLGSDDAFSAGWSFQLHSRMMDEWSPGLAGWIGKVPGLGDDGKGGRVVRWAGALSQMIITPQDLSIEAPQPDDAPYAGLLGVTSTWSAYDNKKLAALQIYAGCMGPCSQAEDVQKFIHGNLGWGEPPKGWGNQLSNKALGNLNYEYRHKVYVAQEADYAFGRFATDLALSGQAGVGNLETFARGEVEFRFGWGMPMGFTKVPDPPGIGTVLDPIYFDPGRPAPKLDHWSYVFNVVARYAWINYLAPAEGGPTENGGSHPSFDPPGKVQGLLGLHLVRVPFGIHITYFRYFDNPDPNLASSLDWVNFSFEYRF